MNKLILIFICLVVCSCLPGCMVYPPKIKHVHIHFDDREYQCEELYGRRANFILKEKGCATYYGENICLDEGGRWVDGLDSCIMPLKEGEHE